MTRSQEQFRRLLVILSVALSALLAPLLVLPAAASAGTCPNEQLRSEANSANLPDCRAYELVTPPFKEASIAAMESLSFVGGFNGMSADGSQVAVSEFGNPGDSQGAARVGSYDLTRTASGWTETSLDIPASRFPAGTVPVAEEEHAFASEPILAAPDFGKFLYISPPAQNDGHEHSGSFWIGEADGALHSLGSGEGRWAGASRDLSHVLFDGPGGLEEEDASGGPPVPVGVDPGGSLCPAATYSSPSGTGSLETVSGGTGGMSAEGSVVFFYIPAEGCSPGDPSVGELFARVEESRTVAISEPSKVDCSACDTSSGGEANQQIDGASPDGSKVFFTTTQPLLDGTGGIYEYDFDAPAGEKVRLVGREGSVVRVSEDGSHVYFTSGAGNLYVYDTETGATAFIATVSNGPNDAAVTPDGQFLVFTSSTPDLTPGDTSTAQQAFEYDAGAGGAGSLTRVSIGQNGFNENGNSDTFGANLIPGEHDNYFPGPEYMSPLTVSNDGAYVAFESSDGLTPEALNGQFEELAYEEVGHKAVKTYYAENVYEYHDGNVYLISDGRDTSFSLRAGEGSNGASAVRLRGMSPSGEDIFFETADSLVPQDLDTQVDLYDARIDGGFPAPVSLLPTCTGDACQGPLSSAPTLLSPGSEFQAGGNPPLTASAPAPAVKPKPKTKAKACKKGYVKKDGKCVKKPKAKKAKAKKSSNDRRASR